MRALLLSHQLASRRMLIDFPPLCSQSFYSPTDTLVSPCTQKLHLAKKKHHLKCAVRAISVKHSSDVVCLRTEANRFPSTTRSLALVQRSNSASLPDSRTPTASCIPTTPQKQSSAWVSQARTLRLSNLSMGSMVYRLEGDRSWICIGRECSSAPHLLRLTLARF